MSDGESSSGGDSDDGFGGSDLGGESADDEQGLSQMEAEMGQQTQGDALQPARRTRQADVVESRLQATLTRAVEAMRASAELTAEEAEEEEVQKMQRLLTGLMADLGGMPQARAATWRLAIGAELARLASVSGDSAGAEFQESQVEKELAKAREERQRAAEMKALEEEDDDRESEESDAGDADDDAAGQESLGPGEYSVETILDRYAQLGGVFYYVKWVGYAVGIDAWQPAANVESSLILAFEQLHGRLAPGQDDLRRVLRRRPRSKKYLLEANRGYNVELERKSMLPATLAKVDAFDAEEKARRRREGAAGGGGGRPAFAGGVDGGESDEETGAAQADNGGSGPPGGGSGPPGGGPAGQVGRLLVWDSNTSDLRLSVSLALKDGNFVVESRILWDSLLEWTVTRLWLLETVVPPASVVDDDAMLKRIATTCYAIEKVAFDTEYKMTPGGPTYQQHYEFEVAGVVQRMRSRWRRLRTQTTQERDALRSQLRALRRIGHARGFALLPPAHPADPTAEQLVTSAGGARWWVAFTAPAARSTKQNNLVRYRNAETKRFLHWMRTQWYPPTPNRSLQAQRSDGLGSVFDGKIPTSALEASSTQVEHTVAQSWFENTELMQEFCHAREDVNNTLPIPAMQNAKKGARPIWFTSDVPSNPGKVDHSWFMLDDPTLFTPRRQAAAAARVFYTFLSYPLITQQNDSQSALDRQGKGCSYYANQHVHAHMLATVRDQQPLPHDVYENLVTLFLFRTYNPLLQDHTLLHTHEFAPEFKALLKERLEGSTSFPAMCGAALRSAVSGFPV